MQLEKIQDTGFFPDASDDQQTQHRLDKATHQKEVQLQLAKIKELRPIYQSLFALATCDLDAFCLGLQRLQAKEFGSKLPASTAREFFSSLDWDTLSLKVLTSLHNDVDWDKEFEMWMKVISNTKRKSDEWAS